MKFLFQKSWVPIIVLALVLAMTGTYASRLAASELSKDDLAKQKRYGQYGGPFTLVDHNGRTVTDTDFLGRYLLVYFGYTFCPDVCPTAMQSVSDTLDLLGDTGKIIQPLFVSVDPERDTVEVLADFVSNFHPRILGLTGTKEQLLAVADNYGAQFHKVFAPATPDSLSQGEDLKADYLINHSAATYLMGPGGKFIMYYLDNASPEEIAAQIRKILDKS